jgi:hypothetical protein
VTSLRVFAVKRRRGFVVTRGLLFHATVSQTTKMSRNCHEFDRYLPGKYTLCYNLANLHINQVYRVQADAKTLKLMKNATMQLFLLNNNPSILPMMHATIIGFMGVFLFSLYWLEKTKRIQLDFAALHNKRIYKSSILIS